ncbi:MAG: class I SAM-dependent methyltransferase [Glycocaulis sp.]
MIADPERFIAEHTRIASAPLVPELNFHLADETIAIWQSTEEALRRQGLPPPFWAFAWAGGQALARYVMDNPDIVAGRHVLDFACGCAVAGIGAAKAGAARVDASEIDPFAVAAAHANARLNAVALHAREIDLVGEDGGWDVVLAGDVFYEGPGAQRIAAWLADLHRRGCTVLIGDPGRTFLPREQLEPLARYDTPVSRDLEDKDVRLARVWQYRG